LLENVPPGPMALLPRAELALAKRDVRQARGLVHEVRRLNPSHPALLRRLGLLLLYLREWKELENLARLALKADERDPIVWLGLAEASLRQRKAAEAEEAAQRAIQLKYFLPDAHFVLARALVAQNKWDAAREAMSALLKLQPDNKSVAGYKRRLERRTG
jgi:predicted Zn-dependent protease